MMARPPTTSSMEVGNVLFDEKSKCKGKGKCKGNGKSSLRRQVRASSYADPEGDADRKRIIAENLEFALQKRAIKLESTAW